MIGNFPIMIGIAIWEYPSLAKNGKSCFFEIWQVTSIMQSLMILAMKTLVTHLLEVVLTTATASWLVLVTNCCTNCKWFRTPRLVSLQYQEIQADEASSARDWVILRQWITYETALLVYKCIHGLASSYLVTSLSANVILRWSSNIRSASLHQLHVPRTRTCYGDRNFIVNCPDAQNGWLVDLWSALGRLLTGHFQRGTENVMHICGLGEICVVQITCYYDCYYYYLCCKYH